jgi:hypothetical protein
MKLSNVTSGLKKTGNSSFKQVIFTNDDLASVFFTNTPDSEISQKDKICRK